MSGFYSYDAWKTTPPPDDDSGEMAREEYEQRLVEQEQEEYDRGAADADERAPWPGDPERPFNEAQRPAYAAAGGRK